MKRKRFILFVSISILSLSVLALSLLLGSMQSDEEAETITSTLPYKDSSAPRHVSNTAPTLAETVSVPVSTSEPSPTITPIITQPLPVKRPQTTQPATQAPDSSRQEVLLSISKSLRVEEGLTDKNLLILRQFNERLSLSNEELRLLALPQDFVEALQAMNRASLAEQALQKQWQDRVLKDIHGYQTALLSQRRKILGDELYTRLHEPDQTETSDDGYSVEYVQAKSDVSEQDRLVRDKQEPLLQAWQRGQLSETELRENLLADLSDQAVDQVIDSAQYELDWQNRLEHFLNEYHYVEQAGLEGEDEKQIRIEMLERHFSKEDSVAADLFLFGEQTLAALPSAHAELEK